MQKPSRNWFYALLVVMEVVSASNSQALAQGFKQSEKDPLLMLCQAARKRTKTWSEVRKKKIVAAYDKYFTALSILTDSVEFWSEPERTKAFMLSDDTDWVPLFLKLGEKQRPYLSTESPKEVLELRTQLIALTNAKVVVEIEKAHHPHLNSPGEIYHR